MFGVRIMQSDWMTLDQVAKCLKISTVQARKWLEDKGHKWERFHGEWAVKHHVVDPLLAEEKPKAKASASAEAA